VRLKARRKRPEEPVDRKAIADDLAKHLAAATDPAERARLLLLLEDVRARETKNAPSIAAAIVFVLCFVVAGFLVLKHVDSTELDARVNSGSLMLTPADASQSLLRQLSITEIVTTDGTVIDRHVRKPGELTHLVRVTCRTPCQMVLDGIDMAGVGTLELQRGGRTSQLRVAASGNDLRTKVTAAGQLLLEDASGHSELANFATPEKLDLAGDGAALNAEVRTPPADTIPLSGLSVSSIDFHTTEEESRDDRLVMTRRSSILDGVLHLRPVNTSTSLLNEDDLEIAKFSGRIYELVMKPDRFSVALIGRAADLRLGPKRQSLLPSVLEVLRAHSGLTVYWASAVWLAGIVVSLLQWYRPNR
jgi:hypothetical protein